MYVRFIKRPLGLIISLLGIIVLAVPMMIIAVLIKLESKGSVIFRQEREGKEHRKFIIYKFRTMSVGAYEQGGIVTSEKDLRITTIGRILRRTSLDELPQLFNIVKGEMAIIGPRPILDWEYKEFASDLYEERFSVRAGMFCTVDVDYRASADRHTQFKMDVEYARHITFWGDAKVFWEIIRTVLIGKNVYKEECTQHG